MDDVECFVWEGEAGDDVTGDEGCVGDAAGGEGLLCRGESGGAQVEAG